MLPVTIIKNKKIKTKGAWVKLEIVIENQVC